MFIALTVNTYEVFLCGFVDKGSRASLKVIVLLHMIFQPPGVKIFLTDLTPTSWLFELGTESYERPAAHRVKGSLCVLGAGGEFDVLDHDTLSLSCFNYIKLSNNY